MYPFVGGAVMYPFLQIRDVSNSMPFRIYGFHGPAVKYPFQWDWDRASCKQKQSLSVSWVGGKVSLSVVDDPCLPDEPHWGAFSEISLSCPFHRGAIPFDSICIAIYGFSKSIPFYGLGGLIHFINHPLQILYLGLAVGLWINAFNR